MAHKRKISLAGWFFRLGLYGIFLVLLAAGAGIGAYYAGMRLPIYSDVASLALQNWNRTRDIAVEANYDSSLVRRDDRIHIAVDLALPQTVQRLRDYLNGGRTLLVDCGRQQLYLHQLENASLNVADPVVSLAGLMDIELAGLLNLREGRRVTSTVRLGHDRTTIWADVTSLKIEGLPDPLVEPILQEIARVTYTREEVLDLAAGSLSPELASLIATHRDALDLAFEDIVAAKEDDTLALEAVFSINESAAFRMIGDQFAEATSTHATRLAGMLGPSAAAAQGLGQIGDILDQLGGSEARKIIEEGLEGQGLKELEDIATTLAGLTDCHTAF